MRINAASHPTTPSPPHTASPEQPRAAARTLAFALLLLLLNLQGDGLHLGDPTSLPFQLRLLPVTLLALALLALTLFPAPLAQRLPAHLTHVLTGWRAPLLLATVFLALAVPLFLAEAHVYARFGYHLRPALAAPVFLVSLLALASHLLPRRAPTATRLALTLAAVVAAVSLLSLRSFPLALQRSDMLPLLAAANHTLLQHHDPYRLYTFPSETVLLTYLPGTLLAFLPTTALHLDLRLTNLFALLLFIPLTLAATRPSQRLRAVALLANFLLGPYLLYRHELYTPPHWLTLAAALLLAHAGRLRLAALLFGVSIALSQFSWILLPFFLLYLLQTHGPRAALKSFALSLLAAAALVLPFLLADSHAFLVGTLSHWSAIGLTARPINLSFFTAALVGPQHLPLVQLVVLAVLFLAALRTRACGTFAGTLRLMALALASFVLLNFLVWGYFFLLLELLILLHLLAAEDAFTPAASHPVTPPPNTPLHPHRQPASNL